MASGAGQLIEDIDYSSLYTRIAGVYGRNDDGYGQIMAPNPAANDVLITAADWQNLRNYVLNSRVHQIGTSTSLVSITAGQVISYTNHLLAIGDMSTLCVTDKRAIHPTQYSTPAETSSSSPINSWGGDKSTGRLNIKIRITGPNMHQDGEERGLRYFFNAGGALKLRFALTDVPISGVSSAKSSTWQAFLNNIGTISINYNTITGSGNTAAPVAGFYGITSGSSPVEIFRRNSSGLYMYSENYFSITAQRQTGYIDFNCTWYDVDSGEGVYVYATNPDDEPVIGTMITYFTQDLPSGSYVSIDPTTFSIATAWNTA